MDFWLLRRLLLGRVIFFLNQEIPVEDVGVNQIISIGLVVVVVVFDSLIIVMYPYVFAVMFDECIANVVATVEKSTKNNSVTNGLHCCKLIISLV